MEFLDLIERVAASDADARSVFQGEGSRARTSDRMADPKYVKKLSEAAKFVQGVVTGTRPSYHLREAMTTSDFPILFGDILDRQVLASYNAWPMTWSTIAQRKLVNDFRNVRLYPPMIGGDQRLLVVDQQEEYPARKLDESTAMEFAVLKYGARMPFSWEAMINDDTDQLKDIPTRFGRAARRSEARFVAELFLGASGPHATLYSNANKNIINVANGALANNPTLSIAGLQDAWRVLSSQKDELGEPIIIEMATLVVPPALEITAQNILNAIQIETTTLATGAQPPNPATSGEQKLIINNWMRNKLTLIVDPYIPMIATTANGNSSWFMFANPSVGRPALVIGFLRGHEQPEIWIKSPNAVRAGGGAVNPMEGDFDTDSIQYRVRHVFGGRTVDPKSTVASNGSAV